MGQPDADQPNVSTHSLKVGDYLFFATDGITRVIEDDEFPGILTGEQPPSGRLAQLIDITNDRGGPDNATAVLVETLAPTSIS